jgi:outer membrane protein assembly factor BamB
MKTQTLLVMVVCLSALSARGDDWPQYRGPNRDDVSKEKGLLATWPAGGPKLLWTYKEAGLGYSGPAIVGDTLYTMGARGDDEYLIALDLTKSPPVQKWAEKIGPTFTWKSNNWNKGPNATPTVVGDLVFALGGQGDLICATTDGKKVLWRKSMLKDLKGAVNPIGGGPEKIGWGYAGSPLVDGDNLICVPGGAQGAVAALNKKTGEVVWRSKGLKTGATYASLIVSDAGGVRQYIITTQEGAAGIAAKDGAVLWEYKREEPYSDILATTPVAMGNSVFISGYPEGSDLIEVAAAAGGKFTTTATYSTTDLQNRHGGVVLVDGYLYGASGDQGAKWVCMEFKSGKVKWSVFDRKLGAGSLTYADGHLYCLGQRGTMALVVASPKDQFKVVSSFPLPPASPNRPKQGGVWTHPVIANGKLYLRDQELLYCYEVK